MSQPPDVVIEDGDGALRFFWVEDRYQHRLETNHGITRSLAASGIRQPVYTEAHQQGELLFLSGHADFGHCSASVERSEKGFLIDVAIRLKARTAMVGSAYAVEQGTVNPADETCHVHRDRGEAVAMPRDATSSASGTVRYRYLLAP